MVCTLYFTIYFVAFGERLCSSHIVFHKGKKLKSGGGELKRSTAGQQHYFFSYSTSLHYLLLLDFSGRNFITEADGSGILQDFQSELHPKMQPKPALSLVSHEM